MNRSSERMLRGSEEYRGGVPQLAVWKYVVRMRNEGSDEIPVFETVGFG